MKKLVSYLTKGSDFSGGDGKRISEKELDKYSQTLSAMKSEIARVVVGQQAIVDALIRALLCDGHVLLEGVPGIAKTLSIKTLAQVSGCEVERVQFTVDLLPSDIIGITMYEPGKGFKTVKGPIFTNFMIADEINRSPPKTQSALIEAMQERQVTISKETYKLPTPFFVMASQNPIETSGVYSLPEAEIDRFIFKLIMPYPKVEEELKILEQNTTLSTFESYKIKQVSSPQEIITMQKLAKQIYVDERVKKYILNIIQKTRTKDFMYGEFIDWGCSPRASIALFIASKVQAFMSGRAFVTPHDVHVVAHDVLRHRIILSYRARTEGIDADKVISHILEREVIAP